MPHSYSAGHFAFITPIYLLKLPEHIVSYSIKSEMQTGDIRKTLINYLDGEHAHVSLDNALKNLPDKLIGIKAEGFPYSIWQLLEHIRITQWDMVEFCINPEHQSPDWPDQYWPKTEKPEDELNWKKSVASFHNDRKRLIHLVKDERINLLEPFKHGTGQTLMREVLMVIDHTAYHTGQIVLLRKLLKAW